MGGVGEGGEGDGFVLQVQLRAACLHAPRQFGLGYFLIDHQLVYYPHRPAAASSASVAATHSPDVPSLRCSFFQKGARVFK